MGCEDNLETSTIMSCHTEHAWLPQMRSEGIQNDQWIKRPTGNDFENESWVCTAVIRPMWTSGLLHWLSWYYCRAVIGGALLCSVLLCYTFPRAHTHTPMTAAVVSLGQKRRSYFSWAISQPTCHARQHHVNIMRLSLMDYTYSK